MKRFFSLTSEPIPIGGPDHLMYIALLVLTAALLIGRRRWVRDHARQVAQLFDLMGYTHIEERPDCFGQPRFVKAVHP